MIHGDNGSSERQPMWRTPVLTNEAVVEVTNGDTTPLGTDGQETTYGNNLGFTS